MAPVIGLAPLGSELVNFKRYKVGFNCLINGSGANFEFTFDLIFSNTDFIKSAYLFCHGPSGDLFFSAINPSDERVLSEAVLCRDRQIRVE